MKNLPIDIQKRLVALELRKLIDWPVLMIPAPMDLATWRHLAAEMQRRLKENARDNDRAVDYSDLPDIKLVPHR